MKCPRILPILIVACDAKSAALLSCRFAKPGFYTPIVSGLHLGGVTSSVEANRIHNLAARAKAKLIVCVGLDDDSYNSLSKIIPRKRLKRIRTQDQDPKFYLDDRGDGFIRCSENNIGSGLLDAMRSRKILRFDGVEPSNLHIKSKSKHMVICEDDDELTQVIAANYAFALRAGIKIIPSFSRNASEALVEKIHDPSSFSNQSLASVIDEAKLEMRTYCGELGLEPGGSVTFIGSVPYGFAYPEIPSTHLPKYPYLGASIINGFSVEQNGRAGIKVACVVDPGVTLAPEIEEAAEILASRGALVRGFRSKNASNRNVSEMVELFPYDLLIFATHCGDAPGWRMTYNYKDSKGRERCLVVDTAASFELPDTDGLIRVMEFESFVSLDGVAWNDPHKGEKIEIGTAIIDFVEQRRAKSLNHTIRQDIDSVPLSAALMMSDGIYLAAHHNIAAYGTPIVFNNACSSWRRLVSNFISAGARAYIGTLFSITNSEAQEVMSVLLKKHFQKPLPVALWAAQRDVYKGSGRMPYHMEGVFTQSIQVDGKSDAIEIMNKKMTSIVNQINEQSLGKENEIATAKDIKRMLSYYEAELKFVKYYKSNYRQ